MRKLIGLGAFAATGAGMLASTLMNTGNITNAAAMAVVGCFATISIAEHYFELKD
jgi:hypothetical protein